MDPMCMTYQCLSQQRNFIFLSLRLWSLSAIGDSCETNTKACALGHLLVKHRQRNRKFTGRWVVEDAAVSLLNLSMRTMDKVVDVILWVMKHIVTTCSESVVFD